MSDQTEKALERIEGCIAKWLPVKSAFEEKWFYFDHRTFIGQDGYFIESKRWNVEMLSHEVSEAGAAAYVAEANDYIERYLQFRTDAGREFDTIRKSTFFKSLRAAVRLKFDRDMRSLLSHPSGDRDSFDFPKSYYENLKRKDARAAAAGLLAASS